MKLLPISILFQWKKKIHDTFNALLFKKKKFKKRIIEKLVQFHKGTLDEFVKVVKKYVNFSGESYYY